MNYQPHDRRNRMRTMPRRSALTVLELLVAIGASGMLAALLLPAIGSARESARRVQCVNHQHQIGVALHAHHNSHSRLPAGWTYDSEGFSAYGWAVALLPMLEREALARQIDVRRSVAAAPHERARLTSLEMMLCPSDIADPTFILYEDTDLLSTGVQPNPSTSQNAVSCMPLELPTANYLGVFGTIEPDDMIPAPIGDGTFLENHATRFRDLTRGLTNTIVVGERTMAQAPSTWFGVVLSGEDAAARVVGSMLEGLNNSVADECDFSSRHPGGANFLWGDGHVTFVSEDVDLDLYHLWPKLR
ncbi:MAG: DUF1559 domain-containing protein [Pirellulaceae bacterium]